MLERTFVSYKTVFGVAGFIGAGAGGAIGINQWVTHTQIEKAKVEIQKDLNKIEKDLNEMNKRFDTLESLIQERNRRWVW
jgi:hypothetical protein